MKYFRVILYEFIVCTNLTTNNDISLYDYVLFYI